MLTFKPHFTLPYRSLLWVLGLALLLRLASLPILPPRPVDDTYWYVSKGNELLTDRLPQNDPLNFGPGYAMLAGGADLLFGSEAAPWILRVVQGLLGALTCASVWRIAYRLSGDTRIATIAGLGIALNPIFIIENSNLTSETLFIFLLCWALSIYITAPGETEAPRPRALVAAGSLLALATLTRAMLLLFPVGLAIHLALTLPWRRALKAASVLLLAYAAVLGIWTLYNRVKFDRWVVGASGMADVLLMGATGYNGPYSVDAVYAAHNGGAVPTGADRNTIALNTVTSTILADPLGYLVERFRQLGEAVLQPHNTTFFGGESLKTLAVDWLRSDRSIGGLARLVGGDAFWPKLSLYAAHYLALIFGLAGIVLTRRQWRAYAPLSGLIVYTLLLHVFLMAIPRYLFPMIPALWVFAAVGIVWAWEKVAKTVFSRPLLRRPVNPSAP
jgi:4-amino-4-deoxy-L-arabinose transferase-like glycosyltransferase